MEHASLTGPSLHSVVHTWAALDPGAIGAGKMWVDLTDPVNPAFKVRNLTNDGWVDITGGIVGILDTLATHTDVSNAQTAIENNDNANTAAIEGAITTSEVNVNAHGDANHTATQNVVNAGIADAEERALGTGRDYYARWPFDGSAYAGALGGSRGNSGSASVGSFTAAASGAAVALQRYLNATAARFLPGVGFTGSGQVWKWAALPAIRETAVPALAFPMAAWLHRATIAVGGALATAPVDIGVSLQIADAVGVMAYSKAGIYFGLTETGALIFAARLVDGGALTINDVVTPVGFDYQTFHDYELRYGSAVGGAQAWVQGYLDGVAITTRYTWDSGLLPTATNYWRAMASHLTSQGGLPTYNAGMEIVAARTEKALGA